MKGLKLLFCLCLLGNIFAQDMEREIGKLYFQKKYDEVLKRTSSIILEEPENPSANLMKGRTLVDIGKTDEGKPYLENAIKYDSDKSWKTAWGLYYLGLVEFTKENPGKAKEYLNQCLELNSTKNVNKAAKSLLLVSGLDDFYNDWKTVETKNLRFHFQNDRIVEDLEKFAESRQEAFEKNNKFFNVSLPKKIDFIVWNSVEDAQQVGIKQLGFARPQFCVIHSRTNQTRGHEITHVITKYLPGSKNYTRIINEGVAVAFDRTDADKLELAKKSKAEMNYQADVSIAEAWNGNTKYPEWVYYPLAGELVKRLLQIGGKEKLLRLLIDQSYENALTIYGEDLNKIISELEAQIN